MTPTPDMQTLDLPTLSFDQDTSWTSFLDLLNNENLSSELLSAELSKMYCPPQGVNPSRHSLSTLSFDRNTTFTNLYSSETHSSEQGMTNPVASTVADQIQEAIDAPMLVPDAPVNQQDDAASCMKNKVKERQNEQNKINDDAEFARQYQDVFDQEQQKEQDDLFQYNSGYDAIVQHKKRLYSNSERVDLNKPPEDRSKEIPFISQREYTTTRTSIGRESTDQYTCLLDTTQQLAIWNKHNNTISFSHITEAPIYDSSSPFSATGPFAIHNQTQQFLAIYDGYQLNPIAFFSTKNNDLQTSSKQKQKETLPPTPTPIEREPITFT